MNTRSLFIPTVAAAVTAAPRALAHGPHSADATLYHYLSSPDHVLGMFAVVALTLLTVVWSARRTAAPVKRKTP